MEKRITNFMIDPDQLRITTKYDIDKWIMKIRQFLNYDWILRHISTKE